MKSVNPYINFNGNAEEAFKFYQSVFGGELQIVRYKDLEDNMGLTGEDLNQIGNATLPLVDGTLLYGGDVPEPFGQPEISSKLILIPKALKKQNDCSTIYRMAVKLKCLYRKPSGPKNLVCFPIGLMWSGW